MLPRKAIKGYKRFSTDGVRVYKGTLPLSEVLGGGYMLSPDSSPQGIELEKVSAEYALSAGAKGGEETDTKKKSTSKKRKK